jgi:glucokinase
MRRVLVGDIGGTNARFAVAQDGRLRGLGVVPTAGLPTLPGLLEWAADLGAGPLDAVSLAVAAPVQGRRLTLTNVDWTVDLDTIDLPGRLINDLEAAAAGLDGVPDADKRLVVPGTPDPAAPAVVMGVGTGLGVALRFGGRPYPGEGGHQLISPRTARQQSLVAFLRAELGRAPEWEDALSGPGLGRLLRFARQTHAPDKAVLDALDDCESDAERAALVSGNPSDPAAADASRLYAELLGVAARNLCLTTLGRGGVYLCGGVAQRMAHALDGPDFARGFRSPGPVMDAIAEVPVVLLSDPLLHLRGAAALAP